MKLFDNLCYDYGKFLCQLPLVTTALLYNCGLQKIQLLYPIFYAIPPPRGAGGGTAAAAATRLWPSRVVVMRLLLGPVRFKGWR